MSALNVLIERVLANTKPTNMFWLRDNAEQAATELTELCTALDKARKVIDGYLTAGMHTHGDFAFEEDWERCPRCIARKNLSAWLEEFKE